MMKEIKFIDLELCEYKKAWDYQNKIHTNILQTREAESYTDQAGELIFVEHPHVYTQGNNGRNKNLLVSDEFLKRINATFYQSNRGGDITYHGPGQIVGYPIFDLEHLHIGVRDYIYKIEEVLIQTLLLYNIKASRLEGATGVWLDPDTAEARKICAIGVRVSKAVTMHGFALNVNTDLSYFTYINPCGFEDKGVTSMQKELGRTINMEKVKLDLRNQIGNLFSLEIEN